MKDETGIINGGMLHFVSDRDKAPGPLLECCHCGQAISLAILRFQGYERVYYHIKTDGGGPCYCHDRFGTRAHPHDGDCKQAGCEVSQ